MKNKVKASTKRKGGTSSRRDDPTVKRLRLSDPDLSIVVGEGDQQKTYECYSQIMAMYSGYIDAALALPMREHKTMTLTFPEIDPPVWDKMLTYLHLGAAPPECVNDVQVVFPWYDKYDFDAGLELCDTMLRQVISRPLLNDSNLDESTAAMELLYLYAHRMTPATTHQAKKCLLKVLQSGLEGRISLEHGHICQLVPGLRVDDDAWSYTKDRIIRRFPDDGDREKYLDSMAFPDLVVTCILAKSFERDLVPLLPDMCVKVLTSGGGPGDGHYYKQSTYWQQEFNAQLHHIGYVHRTWSS